MTGGPYRYSRNPVYLSFMIIMHLGVIQREERYLERKFGQAYLQCKASVRRWL